MFIRLTDQELTELIRKHYPADRLEIPLRKHLLVIDGGNKIKILEPSECQDQF